MWKGIAIGILSLTGLWSPACAQSLPGGFVYLRDIEPGIRQDIRYAGANNFIGRPLAPASVALRSTPIR